MQEVVIVPKKDYGEKCRKKREAEAARRARIKEDPALYKLQWEKEKEKYLKKLQKGQVRPVSKMTKRGKHGVWVPENIMKKRK